MIRFSQSFNAELLAAGNLLRISVPIMCARGGNVVRVDHLWWEYNTINILAEIRPPGPYVKTEDFMVKYKDLRQGNGAG